MCVCVCVRVWCPCMRLCACAVHACMCVICARLRMCVIVSCVCGRVTVCGRGGYSFDFPQRLTRLNSLKSSSDQSLHTRVLRLPLYLTGTGQVRIQLHSTTAASSSCYSQQEISLNFNSLCSVSLSSSSYCVSISPGEGCRAGVLVWGEWASNSSPALSVHKH